MLILNGLRTLPSAVRTSLHRNMGISAVCYQKIADPIQKLFVDKVKEYTLKSKSSGGKLVDASPEIEKELKDDLSRIEKQYGGGKGVDLAKFPSFTFQEPKIDPINQEN